MALPTMDFTSAVGKAPNIQELIGKELENSFNRVRSQYAEPKAQADIAHTLAQAENQRRQAQFGSLSGPAAQAFGIHALEQMNHPAAADARRLFDLTNEATRSNIENRTDIMKYRPWQSLNSDQKENQLSVGRSLVPNMSDLDLVDYYSSGGTNEKLAQITGQDIGNAGKEYAATGGTREKIQAAQGAQAEAQSLESFITKGMKPYSRTFAGYSPKQIIKSLGTDPENNETTSDFLAARALSLENAGARIRQAGLSDAKEILQQMQEKSLNNVKAFKSLVSPEVYELTQNKITRELGKATDARINALKGLNRKGPTEQQFVDSVQQQGSGEMITIRNPKTGETRQILRSDYERGRKK